MTVYCLGKIGNRVTRVTRVSVLIWILALLVGGIGTWGLHSRIEASRDVPFHLAIEKAKSSGSRQVLNDPIYVQQLKTIHDGLQASLRNWDVDRLKLSVGVQDKIKFLRFSVDRYVRQRFGDLKGTETHFNFVNSGYGLPEIPNHGRNDRSLVLNLSYLSRFHQDPCSLATSQNIGAGLGSNGGYFGGLGLASNDEQRPQCSQNTEKSDNCQSPIRPSCWRSGFLPVTSFVCGTTLVFFTCFLIVGAWGERFLWFHRLGLGWAFLLSCLLCILGVAGIFPFLDWLHHGNKCPDQRDDKPFGSNVDFAQIVKTYVNDGSTNAERKYSAPDFVIAEKKAISGFPNMALASTSYVERLNGTTRLHMRRLTRLTYAFSKKLENFEAAVALHFAYYNFVKRHNTLRCTPAMAAGVEKSFLTVSDLVEAA